LKEKSDLESEEDNEVTLDNLSCGDHFDGGDIYSRENRDSNGDVDSTNDCSNGRVEIKSNRLKKCSDLKEGYNDDDDNNERTFQSCV
jgi:hypothetical protein